MGVAQADPWVAHDAHNLLQLLLAFALHLRSFPLRILDLVAIF
jgi:hypothetical protein